MLARSRNSCAESYRLPYRITCLFIRLRCTCISSKLVSLIGNDTSITSKMKSGIL